MAGNAQEWVLDKREDGFTVVRGGDAYVTERLSDAYFLSYENARDSRRFMHFGLGFRCALTPATQR